jgi:nickel/cobalt exporter
MNSTILTTIALTGFVAAFRHAAIPSHWLPFVFVGRTRGWSRKKTLGIVLLAGSGHLATNTLLGVPFGWKGFCLLGALFIAFGILIVVLESLGLA